METELESPGRVALERAVEPVLAAARDWYKVTRAHEGDDYPDNENRGAAQRFLRAAMLAIAKARAEVLREMTCDRWSGTEYTCLARLGRGESLFGNDPCIRCRTLAAAEALVERVKAL